MPKAGTFDQIKVGDRIRYLATRMGSRGLPIKEEEVISGTLKYYGRDHRGH